MIDGKKWRALKTYMTKAFSSIKGEQLRVTDIEPMNAGAVGYTSKNKVIHLSNDNELFNDLDEEHQQIAIIGVGTHELMHQMLTNFTLRERSIQGLPKYEQRIFAELDNILEDARIEHYAYQFVGGPLLAALKFIIAHTYKKAPKLEASEDAFTQYLNALIQFGDMGKLKGHFTFPEAKKVFMETAPLFDKYIYETSTRKAMRISKEVFEIARPLWKDVADTNELIDKMMEELAKSGKSAGSGSGKPSSEASDDSGEGSGSDSKSKCRKISMRELDNAMRNGGSGKGSGERVEFNPETAEEAREAADVARSCADEAREVANEKSSKTSGEGKEARDAKRAMNAAEKAESAAKEAEAAAKEAEAAKEAGDSEGEKAAAKRAGKAAMRASAAAQAARDAAEGKSSSSSSSSASTAEDAKEAAKDAAEAASEAEEAAKNAESKSGSAGESEEASKNAEKARKAAEKARKAAEEAKAHAEAAEAAKEAGDSETEAKEARAAERAAKRAEAAANEAEAAENGSSGEGNTSDDVADAESNGTSGPCNNWDSEVTDRTTHGSRPDYDKCDSNPGEETDDDFLTDFDLDDYELSEDDMSAIEGEIERCLDEVDKEDSEDMDDSRPLPDIEVSSPRFKKAHTCLNRRITVNDPERAVEMYGRLITKLNTGISNLTSQLRRIFKNDQEEKDYRASGKINTKRVNSGRKTARVFDKRHTPANKSNLSVLLLIDESGSMSGSRSEAAKQCAIALAETMNNCNVPCYVIGFTADTSGADAVHNHYVEWRNSAKDRLRLLDITARANNFDGYSIRYAGEILKKHQAEHKLMIVISDGYPACSAYYGADGIADTKDAIRDVRKFASVLGVAIGNDSTETLHYMYGRDFIHISNVNELFSGIAKKIAKLIREWE